MRQSDINESGSLQSNNIRENFDGNETQLKRERSIPRLRNQRPRQKSERSDSESLILFVPGSDDRAKPSPAQSISFRLPEDRPTKPFDFGFRLLGSVETSKGIINRIRIVAIWCGGSVWFKNTAIGRVSVDNPITLAFRVSNVEARNTFDPKDFCSRRLHSPILKREKERREALEAMEGAEEAGAEIAVDSKDLQQQSKAFDKLTDRVEDRQLDSSRVQSLVNCLAYKVNIVFQAMASIAASREADLNAKRLREKELASVKINAADVEIIVNELELQCMKDSSFIRLRAKVLKLVILVNEQLEKNVVERTLRENKGDAVAATRELLSRYPL
ncbi:unnamed protein product [Thlaspi arvense]|uniref:Uncharacterized protein n=1 Tax=Thlaspi arvense TaxID=13288 RepID=A0AAU9S6D8_THLAR|nr:unnamed protein product [Thlaspi arvense]